MARQNGGDADNPNQQTIKEILDDVTEKGRSLLNEGLENAKTLLDEQTVALKKKAQDIGLDDAAVSVRGYVRKHPWRSIGIAVVAGLLLGRLFGPSDRDE